MKDHAIKMSKNIRVLWIPVIAVAAFFPIFFLLTWITGSNQFGAIVAAIAMFVAIPIGLLKRWSVSGAKRHYLVEVTDVAIHVTEPDGATASITRADIAEIAIVTDDAGPWQEDVWWVVTHKTGSSLMYPNGAIGEQDAIGWFNELPGFDDKMVIKAMGSTSVDRFICWKSLS